MFYPLLNGLHAYVGERGRQELLLMAQELQKKLNIEVGFSTSKDQAIAASMQQQMNETMAILQRFAGVTDAYPDEWAKWSDAVVERLDYLANQIAAHGKRWRAEKAAPEIAMRAQIAAQQKAVEEAQQKFLDGEARRQQLESRSIYVGSVLRDVLAQAAAKKIQIASSIKSRFDLAVSYIDRWKGDTGNPNWSGVADSVEATLEGVLKDAQAIKDEILSRPMTEYSTTTSRGTLVVDTTKPSYQAVATAKDRELERQRMQAAVVPGAQARAQAQAQAELAAMLAKQGGGATKTALVIGGVIIAIGVAFWYFWGREK